MAQIKKAVNYKILLILTVVVLISAETVCRVKFFLMHKKEWNYLTAPFLVRPWDAACKRKTVYSDARKKLITITYDDNGFRGDKISFEKITPEFRIFVLGDSTVDSLQPDPQTWSIRMKAYLPETYKHKEIRIINAGRSGFNSAAIKSLFEDKIRYFAPDVTLFYAAANEGVEFTPFADVYSSIERMRNITHKVMYNNSMLYTYLCEKMLFSASKNKKYFWVIDLTKLKRNFLDLNSECLKSNSKFILITQAINAPRFYEGVDTFNYEKVLNFLNSLKDGAQFKYDNEEIMILNQRLAALYLIELCENYNIPYINILNDIENLGEVKRKSMFLDFIHQTPSGDSILGELIGRKLNNLLIQAGAEEETDGTN